MIVRPQMAGDCNLDLGSYNVGQENPYNQLLQTKTAVMVGRRGSAKSMAEISVRIVNRSRFAREVIARSLDSYEDLHVLSHHASITNAVSAVSPNGAEVVVIEYQDTNDGCSIQILKTLRPDLKIVVSGISLLPQCIERCTAAGSSGYIRSDASRDEWAAAIRGAASGHVTDAKIAALINQLLAQRLTNSASIGQDNHGCRVAHKVDASAKRISLTPREKQILALVNQGLSNKSIAIELCVSPNTVKTHISAILSKYQVHRRSEAAALFRNCESSLDNGVKLLEI